MVKTVEVAVAAAGVGQGQPESETRFLPRRGDEAALLFHQFVVSSHGLILRPPSLNEPPPRRACSWRRSL